MKLFDLQHIIHLTRYLDISHTHKAYYAHVILNLYSNLLVSQLAHHRLGAHMFGKTQFVDVHLTEIHRKEFVKWMEKNINDLDTLLVTALLGGNRLSLSYDLQNSTYIGSTTCRDKGNSNDGCCMTSRHGTPEEALFLSLFKLLVICKDADWQTVGGGANWG